MRLGGRDSSFFKWNVDNGRLMAVPPATKDRAGAALSILSDRFKFSRICPSPALFPVHDMFRVLEYRPTKDPTGR